VNNIIDSHIIWLRDVEATLASYRRMIDATIAQLTDGEFFRRPADGFNSVAILLRHLGGNLTSRWTDCLTTDGEKPDRNRDAEFEPWPGDRASLLAYFDRGWQILLSALQQLNASNIEQTIYIRGEAHGIPQAILRSLSHISYHVGQITITARMVHDGSWQWLTIAPGSSAQHNQSTWGTPAARGKSAEGA